MSSDPLAITCRACADVMARVEVYVEGNVTFDLYRCNNGKCTRKAVVIFEPEGGLSADEQTFVEKEIARRGAFFPADYTGGKIGRLR